MAVQFRYIVLFRMFVVYYIKFVCLCFLMFLPVDTVFVTV